MTAPMPRPDSRTGHKVRLALVALGVSALLITLAVYGLDYYLLTLAERARSPKHPVLRSSGSVGIRIGMLGALMFCVLYGYAIRKKWPWLSRIGKTKNWLDFHVIAGIAAPLLISFHANFKFQGLPGVAYWIMIAVMLSGFVGRYFYSQIPRSLTTAELSLKEILNLREEVSAQLADQRVFPPDHLARLYHLPDRAEVQAMPLPVAIFTMLKLDIARPFHIAALRREVLSPARRLWTLGGLLSSGDPQAENIVSLARQQSWLMVKILFLDRAHEVFHLWHVVHRPFSYSLAVLMIVHIGIVVLLGYY
jgi:hypothetical protein